MATNKLCVPKCRAIVWKKAATYRQQYGDGGDGSGGYNIFGIDDHSIWETPCCCS